MFSLQPGPPVVAHVCDDIACLTRGAEALCTELERTLGPAGSTWLRSPCLGLCERAPAALITAAGETPRDRVLAPADAGGVQQLLLDAAEGRLPDEPDVFNTSLSVPQAGPAGRRLMRPPGGQGPPQIATR